ncbi:MAG TPA: hypothetical protein PKC97_12075 [Burkholderiaceae bacterium]|nr:hypothetical protein [Burkholderiaceae bacterium]
MHARRHRRCREQGFALLEALIAAVLVAAGAAALLWLQGELRFNADVARQRTEAARLAQADIERLRAFVAVDGGSPGWSEIDDDVQDVTPVASPTRYTLTRLVQADSALALKTIDVTLRWTDRRGQAQQLSLATTIAGHDPALAGALSLPRPAIERR